MPCTQGRTASNCGRNVGKHLPLTLIDSQLLLKNGRASPGQSTSPPKPWTAVPPLKHFLILQLLAQKASPGSKMPKSLSWSNPGHPWGLQSGFPIPNAFCSVSCTPGRAHTTPEQALLPLPWPCSSPDALWGWTDIWGHFSCANTSWILDGWWFVL